jgi:hypothetical protein
MLTLISVTLLFPTALIPLALATAIFSALTGCIAILACRPKLSVISLLSGFTLFLGLIEVEIASKSVENNLPLTLLEFVMLLFAVENLTVTSKRPFFIMPKSGTQVQESLIGTFVQHVLRRSSRAALLFTTSYLISIGTLYLSTSVSRLQLDFSFYVIVVSISLALLVILRKD